MKTRWNPMKNLVVVVLVAATVLTSVYGVKFTSSVATRNDLSAYDNVSKTGKFYKSHEFQILMDNYLQCLKLYTDIQKMWGSDGKEDFSQSPFLIDENGDELTLQQVSEMGGHGYDYDTYLQNYFHQFAKYSEQEVSLVKLTTNLTSLKNLAFVKDGKVYLLANDTDSQKEKDEWKQQKKLLKNLSREMYYDGEEGKLSDFEGKETERVTTVELPLESVSVNASVTSTLERWLGKQYPEYLKQQKILSLMGDFGQEITSLDSKNLNEDVLEDYRQSSGVGEVYDFEGYERKEEDSYLVWGSDGAKHSYSGGTILYVNYGQTPVTVRELCEGNVSEELLNDAYVYDESKEEYIGSVTKKAKIALETTEETDTLDGLTVVPCSVDMMADLAQFYISFQKGLKNFLDSAPFCYDVETGEVSLSSSGEDWTSLLEQLKAGDESGARGGNMVYAAYDTNGASYLCYTYWNNYSMTGSLEDFLKSIVSDSPNGFCAVGVNLESVAATTGKYTFWKEAYDNYTEAQAKYNSVSNLVRHYGILTGIFGFLMFLCILLLTKLIQPLPTDGKPLSMDGKSLFFHVDKVWMEVLLLVMCFLCYLLMNTIHAVFHGTVWYNQVLGKYPIVFTYALFTVILLAILFCYCSLVRRKKQKTLLSGSFLYQCFGKGKMLGRLAGTIWNRYCGLKAFKRYLILFFVYAFFWLMLGIFWMECSWNVTGRVFAAGIFMGLVLMVITGGLIVSAVRNAKAQDEMRQGAAKISSGAITYQIPVSPKWGREQRELAEEINRIREGLEQAVETSLKSERMKTELITNVSHDIKTPLTSVINYVDLLKRETFDNPKAEEYLTVLEQKSQRLKVLIEDLVEASKASSGAMELQITTLNFKELVNQTEGEFEEKFAAAGLTLVPEQSSEEIVFRGDGRRVYRVLENLYGNVAKYALAGTRVYTSLQAVKDGDKNYAEFTIKNISREPLNITPQELTERFVRGEESRTTEGSGLGLSIARSLTELMGGSFTIALDGDLFRVTLRFPSENA